MIVNASLMATTFANDGSDVVIADVLTNETAALCRDALDVASISIVHLTVPRDIAHERAMARHYSLTDEQFQTLHAAQELFGDFDLQIDTSITTVPNAASVVRSLLGRPPRQGSIPAAQRRPAPVTGPIGGAISGVPAVSASELNMVNPWLSRCITFAIAHVTNRRLAEVSVLSAASKQFSHRSSPGPNVGVSCPGWVE